MARVLMERNQYKERWMELQEAVSDFCFARLLVLFYLMSIEGFFLLLKLTCPFRGPIFFPNEMKCNGIVWENVVNGQVRWTEMLRAQKAAGQQEETDKRQRQSVWKLYVEYLFPVSFLFPSYVLILFPILFLIVLSTCYQ